MIALLSATWDEINKLKSDIELAEEGVSGDLQYIVGKLYGKKLVLAASGVGIRRARAGTSFIIQKFKPRLIINAGLGGALSTDLKLGDVVIGESVFSLQKSESKELHNEFSSLEEEFKRVSLLTESRFINEPEEKKRLFESSGASVIDMETWGVVEAAAQSITPVASIRAISDECHERLPDMGAIYGSNGQVDLEKADLYFKDSPELLASYLKFRFTNSPKAINSLNNFLAGLISNL